MKVEKTLTVKETGKAAGKDQVTADLLNDRESVPEKNTTLYMQ